MQCFHLLADRTCTLILRNRFLCAQAKVEVKLHTQKIGRDENKFVRTWGRSYNIWQKKFFGQSIPKMDRVKMVDDNF